jgi:hypothetical protein
MHALAEANQRIQRFAVSNTKVFRIVSRNTELHQKSVTGLYPFDIQIEKKLTTWDRAA